MIRKTAILLVLFALLLGGCNSGHKTAQEFYDENFKWKITIPENLEAVDTAKWAKSRERGLQLVEDTYGEKVEDNTIPIFTFNKGQFNVFEARYEPFDPEVDGDFFENSKLANEILYETFITQMPKFVIDTLTNTEHIDNLVFQVFKVKMSYHNKIVMSAFMYSRLFEKRLFNLNIIYRDEELGQKMLDAWKNSTFGK